MDQEKNMNTQQALTIIFFFLVHAALTTDKGECFVWIVMILTGFFLLVVDEAYDSLDI